MVYEYKFFTISRRSHPAQFWWLRTLRTIFLSLRTRGNVISKGRKRGVHCLPLRIIPCLCPLERDGERERKRVPSIGKARQFEVHRTVPIR